MRTIFKSGIIFICSILFLHISVQAQTNFSGSYRLDKSKTEFDEAPDWIIPQGYQITQNNGDVTIVRDLLDPQLKQQRDTLRLKADGGVFHNDSYSGKKQSFTLKWDADQKGFVVTLHSVTPEGDVFADKTEHWTLSDEGKALSIVLDANQVSNGFKYTVKGYYSKR